MIYTLGTRFNTKDYSFCFKPIVPESGFPPISKENSDAAKRYFTNARLEMMEQLGLSPNTPLKRADCTTLVDRLSSVVITEPIYTKYG